MARKSFLATLIGVAAFAVPNAFADKGGIPHEGSNGQGRPADQTQSSADAQGKAQGKALAKGHAKVHAKAKAKPEAKAKAKTKVKVKSHGKTQAPPATNTHAKAGKTTLCHATGSASNPYVTITISNNAIPAHQRHQDGRDIIPAPAGGCPAGTTNGAQEQEKTPPGQEQAAGTPTNGSSTTAPSSQTSPTSAQGQVLGESTKGSNGTNTSTESPDKVSVLGASTSGTAPSASSSPSATATQASSSSGLPFTGTDAIIVAILGLAALLLGVTVRRATTNRA